MASSRPYDLIRVKLTRPVWYICVLIFLFGTIGLYAQQAKPFKISEVGTPLMKVYSEVGEITNRSSYSVAQNKDGLIYIANSGGLIEFDGIHWEVHLTDFVSAITGAVPTDDGRVYVVSRVEYGYLEPSDQGVLTYHSLVSRTQEAVTDIGTFFYVDRYRDKIVYWSFTDIIVYDPQDESVVVHSAQKFSRGMQVGEDYYIIDWNKGLMKLTDSGLQATALSERFLDLRVVDLIPYTDQSLLVLTSDSGFYLYDAEKLEKWETEVSEFLWSSGPFTGLSIKNQYLVIGSRNQGLVIIDKRGKLVQKIDESLGLPEGAVWDVMFDREGNLWVASWSGITQIILNSPFTVIDGRHGVKGTIAQIKRHQDKIYVTTDQGMYYKADQVPWQKLGGHMPFSEISGTNNSTYVLLPKGEDLIMGSASGIFQVKGDKLISLYPSENYWAGVALEDSDQMFLGSMEGHLQLVEKVNGTWKRTKQLEGFSNQIDFIEEGTNGELWVADSEAGVFKLILNQRKDSILSLTTYDGNNGLPDKMGNRVYKVDREVVFATRKGMYQYNEAEDNFVPIEKYNTPLEGNNVFRFAEDKNGDILTAGGKGKGLLKKIGDGFKFQRTPFQQIWYSNSEYFTSLDTDRFWIGGDGIKVYDPTIPFTPVDDFKAFIRSSTVITKGDSLLFGGIGLGDASGLTVNDNGLEFSYSALFYEKPELVDFQTKLEGYDEDWSDWTYETSRQYHNLKHGTYTFKVRPRNLYAQVGDMDEFTFVILTPWYFTWWAYVLYVIAAISFIWAIVKLNTRRLEREKKALEQTVNERTEEIRQQRDEIEEQANRLRELDKVKSRFFANISHELRTPLTLINAPIESLVHEGKIDDPEVRRTLETATRNGVSLLSLVEEILDLAKLDGGKLELIENPVWLHDYLQLIISAFESGFKSKGINFEYDFRLPENMTILLDENRCGKIIKNLLSNAMKFTPEGGRIILRAKEGHGNRIQIQVEDTGRGIHEKDLPHIFDRYYQSEQPGTKAEGGTGIGLALAKELANLHGGTLTAQSVLGKGSTFMFEIPAKPVREETIIQIAVPESREVEIALKETVERYSTKFKIQRPVLLITEDHPEMRSFVAQTLAPYFEIRQAENGKRALEVLNQEAIDIVISDVMMPVMDGFELLEEIKMNDALHQVSIVMLTARADNEDRLFALTMGIDDYLTKPFSASVFLARIKNILENRIKIIRELKSLSNDKGRSNDNLKAFIQAHDLSDRELEIMRLMAKRYSNKQIGEKLFLSTNTVKYHLKKLYFKLDITSRDEMTERAEQVML